MKADNLTRFPALTVTVTGTASEAISLAAAMFSKTPEQYCRDCLYWLAAMDLEGAR